MPPTCKDKPAAPAVSRFRQSLHNPEEFTLTFELVPSRGGKNRQLDRTLQLAKNIAADGRIQAVSITDNAGGHPALTPEVLGQEILTMGLDVISHFSCKDKNRNEMEGQLFGWDRIGLTNLLIITGDYPKKGYQGHPKPVFDLGSVHVVDMAQTMNSGHYDNQASKPTSFLKGVAVSPFKLTEAEQRMQYYKLHRKIAAGADYVITQLGFDARKYHEVLLYMQQNKLDIPILGSVFIPSMALAGLMHRGQVPGCIIPDTLYAELQQEATAADHGKKARLNRAAKLLAVLKGLGYNGAHIGGPCLTMDDFNFMLDKAKNYAGNWQQLIAELSCWPESNFFHFDKDSTTGLNNNTAKAAAQEHKPFKPVSTLSHFIHSLAFEPDGPLHTVAQKSCIALHNSPLKRPFFALEHGAKSILFGCRNCGDCTLSALSYHCPQSGCAKYLLNGPCGGSRDGWCEVYPNQKKCLFVKAYDGFAARGSQENFKQGFEPPRNWKLNNSSSWLNFFTGKDKRS